MLFLERLHIRIKNQEAIDILNEIAQEIEVVHLEGNHDFNLKNLSLCKSFSYLHGAASLHI